MNIQFLQTTLYIFILLLLNACQDGQSSETMDLISVNQDGMIKVKGKPVYIEALKNTLIKEFKNMPQIPTTIQPKYEGEVLMGMRGEIETEIAAALAALNPNNEAVEVEIQLYRKENGTDCDKVPDERSYCALIDFQYPKVTKGNAALKASVDHWVLQFLTGMLVGGAEDQKTAKTLEKATKIFFKEHESFKGSVMYGAFIADCGSDVIFNNGQYLTLAMNAFTFQGGAHGSPLAAVATFEIATGKKLAWDDLVADKGTAKDLLEAKFREERAEIFKDGFDFDGTFPFKLPDNFGIIKEGIHCHYLHYEVAPYAMNSTTFVLPHSHLGPISKIDQGDEISDAPQDAPDLLDITDAIHNFYTWYAKFKEDESRNIAFVKDNGKYASLDMPKLKQYFVNIKKSGYISDEFVQSEIAILKDCQKYWQKEGLDQPLSCIDYDRFDCSQETLNLDFFAKAPVSVMGLGTNKVVATMSDAHQEQKYDLKKENGKWLITKIYCGE